MKASPKPVNRLTFEIGRRLVARRHELGLSQGAVGKMLSVSQQQIGKYEAGTDRIPADRLFEILDALNFNASALYGTLDTIPVEQVGFAEETPADMMLEAFGNRDTATLVRTYLSIPEGDFRKQALDLVKAVADNVPSTVGAKPPRSPKPRS